MEHMSSEFFIYFFTEHQRSIIVILPLVPEIWGMVFVDRFPYENHPIKVEEVR